MHTITKKTFRRLFLPWNKPLLEQVSTFLCDEVAGTFDLSSYVVALPAKRAGRKLLERLVSEAEKASKVLIPPRIISIGELPELFYTPHLPVAPESVQVLAWVKALQSTPHRKEILPETGDLRAFGEWSSIGKLLVGVWSQIAGAGISFRDVAKIGVEGGSFFEEERWDALEEVCREYLKILKGLGFSDQHANRLQCVRAGEFFGAGKIVIAGMSLIPRIIKDVLSALSTEVTFLVYAPSEHGERFDEFGTVRTESWREALLSIPASALHIAENPRDEVFEIASFLGSLGNRYTVNSVTIGVADEGITPLIQSELLKDEIIARPAAGTPLSNTLPLLFLKLLSQFFIHRRFTDLASFIRHPWVTKKVSLLLTEKGIQCNGLVSCFDRYHERHLPERVTSKLPSSVEEDAVVCKTVEIVEGLLGTLPPSTKEPREFGDALLRLLDTYGESDLRWKEHERGLVVRVLSEWCDVPEELLETISLSEAFSVVLGRAPSFEVPHDPASEVIEVLGWLELLADDAPVLAISGFNESIIPESVTSDPFLPDGLRTTLGLLDNEARYARDAYQLMALLSSRKEIALFARRASYQGEPCTLSRLLLAGEIGEVVQRIASFYGEASGTKNSAPSVLEETKGGRFSVPRPRPLSVPLSRIPVTGFSRYLQCPYRFYLNYVLRLSKHTDEARELSPSLYGSFTHTILKEFGRSPLAVSHDPDAIIEFFNARIENHRAKEFGDTGAPVIALQLENLKTRLVPFAHLQSERAREGWSMLHTEYELKPPHASLIVDGTPRVISGRIDRIDRHPDGRIAIIDYKTSESADGPEKIHRGKDGVWRDLQLPLYYFLLKQEGIISIDGPEPALGYLLLPCDAKDVSFAWASWSKEDLDSAETVIQDIVRAVRQEKFWPPAEDIYGDFDELSAICGVGQRGIVI